MQQGQPIGNHQTHYGPYRSQWRLTRRGAVTWAQHITLFRDVLGMVNQYPAVDGQPNDRRWARKRLAAYTRSTSLPAHLACVGLIMNGQSDWDGLLWQQKLLSRRPLSGPHALQPTEWRAVIYREEGLFFVGRSCEAKGGLITWSIQSLMGRFSAPG
jgi:hypothetical protein